MRCGAPRVWDCVGRLSHTGAWRVVRSGLSLPYELAARERRGKALSATMVDMTSFRIQHPYGND